MSRPGYTTHLETFTMTADDLAASLNGHYDPGPSTVDELTRSRLEALISARGYTLTGLARAMGRSHTWILRKLDPAQANPRPCTVGDVAEILTFLEASPEDLTAAA